MSDMDKRPLVVENGVTENVSQFQYFGSMIADNGLIDTDIDRHIANASKAFGALQRAVFNDRVLTANTKRLIYQACVFPVLLYGCESWTPLKRHLKRLDSFHYRCIQSVLGITNRQ